MAFDRRRRSRRPHRRAHCEILSLTNLCGFAASGDPGNFASVGTVGTATEASSDNSITLTTSAVPVGNLLVLAIAVDNNGTTDADHGEITGVTDSGGNVWTKAREYTNGQGAANAGATISVWFAKVTTALGSGDAITVALSTSKTAKAISAWEFSLSGSASTVSVESGTEEASDNADAGSLAISGLAPRNYLFLRAIAIEAGSANISAATANFTQITQDGNGGGAASGMAVVGEFRILNGTGATSNPTLADTGRDNASVFVALKYT